MRVSLRPVNSEDEAFLLELYRSTRAAEMALVPWTEEQKTTFLQMQFAAQQLHYRKHNPTATHEIILAGEDAVGRLYVARRTHEIRIMDITLLPAHRNRGIGTPLIKELMTEAGRSGLPLNIYVESFNPSLRLFERLGFSQVDGDGINCLMEWRAEPG